MESVQSITNRLPVYILVLLYALTSVRAMNIQWFGLILCFCYRKLASRHVISGISCFTLMLGRKLHDHFYGWNYGNFSSTKKKKNTNFRKHIKHTHTQPHIHTVIFSTQFLIEPKPYRVTRIWHEDLLMLISRRFFLLSFFLPFSSIYLYCFAHHFS